VTETILDKIAAHKKKELLSSKESRPQGVLEERIGRQGRTRDFASSLVRADRVCLIAEIKKASPSAGVIRDAFDPIKIGRVYEKEGVDAISVITDKAFFQGDIAILSAVKENFSPPVLRKDFIIDPYQIYEARAFGADTYERISPPLLAAFDAFEEKRMPSSHLFKDPYCGLGVSPYLLVDRNQIAGLRPFQKLFFGGRGYTCHWLPLRARQRITSQNWRSDKILDNVPYVRLTRIFLSGLVQLII
jgi:hypothetical protein